jgi:hypothetical protein
VLVKSQPDPPQPTSHSTGRRLWLARRLVASNNRFLLREESSFMTGETLSASGPGDTAVTASLHS